MGAAVPRYPIGAQPHERGGKSSSLDLHGHSSATNGITVCSRGVALPSLNEVQNAADRSFRLNEGPCRPPQHHKNQMELHGYQDPVRCRAFSITLKGSALAWFNRLPPASVSSLKELSIAFVSHFIEARMYRKPSYHLLTVKQGPQENLRSYVQRFNLESLRVDITDEKFAITAFIVRLGIQSKNLMFSVLKNPQASMAEVLSKAEKYINGEEALMSKRGSSSMRNEKRKDEKKRDRSPKKQRDRDRSPLRGREDKDRSPKRLGNVKDCLGPPQPKLQPRYPPQQFTPLTASIS